MDRSHREVIDVDPTGVLVIMIVIVAGMLAIARAKDPRERARPLRQAGMVIMAMYASFFGVFVVAETVVEPGGWKAAGLIASWFAPLVAVTAIAWFKPYWGLRILMILTAAVVTLFAWRAFDDGIRDLEDRIGPFTTIAAIAVAVATTVLARTRTRAAGVMLLAIGVAPFVSWGVANLEANLAIVYMALSSPMVASGVLFLLSDSAAERAAALGSRETEGPPLGKAA